MYTVAEINRLIAKGTIIKRLKYEKYPEDIFIWSSANADYIGKQSGKFLSFLVRRDCDFDEIKNKPLISKIDYM